MKLDFESETQENNYLYDQHFSNEDGNLIETEIKKLFSNGIIEKCEQDR